jgi:hypothetical protein
MEVRTQGTIIYDGITLIPWGLIPRPLGRLKPGGGGYVPPHTQIFQGEIFNTPPLGAVIFYYHINFYILSSIFRKTTNTYESSAHDIVGKK